MPIKWDEHATSALIQAMYQVIAVGELSRKQKDEIVERMKEMGYRDANWNGIR